MNSCVIKNQSDNNMLKVGYIALLAVSCIVTLIVLIIILKAMYRRCTGTSPIINSRISSIVNENSNIDLNYNINGNYTQ